MWRPNSNARAGRVASARSKLAPDQRAARDQDAVRGARALALACLHERVSVSPP